MHFECRTWIELLKCPNLTQPNFLASFLCSIHKYSPWIAHEVRPGSTQHLVRDDVMNIWKVWLLRHHLFMSAFYLPLHRLHAQRNNLDCSIRAIILNSEPVRAWPEMPITHNPTLLHKCNCQVSISQAICGSTKLVSYITFLPALHTMMIGESVKNR